MTYPLLSYLLLSYLLLYGISVTVIYLTVVAFTIWHIRYCYIYYIEYLLNRAKFPLSFLFCPILIIFFFPKKPNIKSLEHISIVEKTSLAGTGSSVIVQCTIPLNHRLGKAPSPLLSSTQTHHLAEMIMDACANICIFERSDRYGY